MAAKLVLAVASSLWCTSLLFYFAPHSPWSLYALCLALCSVLPQVSPERGMAQCPPLQARRCTGQLSTDHLRPRFIHPWVHLGMDMPLCLSLAADEHLPDRNRTFSGVLCFWIATRDSRFK
jgi:hypothetical protein